MPYAQAGRAVVEVRLSVEVRRPRQEVFAFLVRAENYPRWQEGIVRIEPVDPGPWRAGTRIRTVHAFLWWRSLVDESCVSELEPDAGFATRGAIGSTRYRESFRLEPVAYGTRLDYGARIEPGGPFRFIRPVAVWAFRSQMQRSFARLKILLEKEPGG